MSLEKIVTVNITRQTAGVTQSGFGTPLILGPNGFADEVRTYSSLAAVAADYATSDAEYVMASKIFSQNPKLPQIKAGLLSTPVAQVVTFTPTVANNTEYVVTINGTPYSFTSDADATAAEIVTGLKAAITDPLVVESGTTTLILTAATAGLAFTYESTGLTAVLTTANNGPAEDIAALSQVDNDWYFLLVTSSSVAQITIAATAIEAYRKLFVALPNDSTIPTNSTSDVASVLQAAGFFRTAVTFSDTLADRLDAGLVGKCAPFPPGSETWALKTVAGVAVDTLTDSQQGFLDDKNVNYMIGIAGVNVTQNGKVAGGEYIDIIRFIDFIQARMQEKIFATLANATKIPYTDAGIAIIEADVRTVLERGVIQGGIVPGSIVVNVPRAADISTNDKAERILTGITFSAQLSGAVQAVVINGTVSL
jgi:hypothetical protein